MSAQSEIHLMAQFESDHDILIQNTTLLQVLRDEFRSFSRELKETASQKADKGDLDALSDRVRNLEDNQSEMRANWKMIVGGLLVAQAAMQFAIRFFLR